MWKAQKHSDDENLRWSWLRALEWGTWPIFISQPIAPVAIVFFSWWTVVLATLIATVFWIVFVRDIIVVPALAFWGAVIVRLKWVTCPIAAYILWQRGARGAAVVAFLWPLLILLMPLLLLPFGMARVSDIQKLFMQCLGYEPPTQPEGDPD
jgi:hypothetical protein